jgi:hypothetical protein
MKGKGNANGKPVDDRHEVDCKIILFRLSYCTTRETQKNAMWGSSVHTWGSSVRTWGSSVRTWGSGMHVCIGCVCVHGGPVCVCKHGIQCACLWGPYARVRAIWHAQLGPSVCKDLACVSVHASLGSGMDTWGLGAMPVREREGRNQHQGIDDLTTHCQGVVGGWASHEWSPTKDDAGTAGHEPLMSL